MALLKKEMALRLILPYPSSMTNSISKTALITGASSGIGKEFAIQLHSLGYNLVLVARREDLLRDLVEYFEHIRPASAQMLRADLTEGSSLQEIIQYIKENQIDLLVNNAGLGSFGYYEELSWEKELYLIQLNIVATSALNHAVIPQMKERGAGEIIVTSSIAGFQPLPLMATYSATKAFNLNQTLALRAELAPYNITVHALCPGPTATEFGGVARVPGTATGGPRETSERVVTECLKALRRGKAYSVPGFRAKVMIFLVHLLSYKVTTNILYRLLKKPLEQKDG